MAADLERWGEVLGGTRVLLTGHTGFKGTWTVHWLHRLGAEVHGLALEPDQDPALFVASKAEERLASHRIVDIRDAAATQAAIAEIEPTLILHLAAQPIVLTSYDDPVGTFATNVMGTAHVLEGARHCDATRATVVVTSDKCYENREWTWGYRENDPMGGHDPYSASKGATELVVSSYRRSFFHDTDGPAVASVRAGNVIGGGDWADRRIVPDAMRAFSKGQVLEVRSPHAVRPWQHVLEPLAGYLEIATELLTTGHRCASAWNFGPASDSARTVGELADRAVSVWGGASWKDVSQPGARHEATLLRLATEKAQSKLSWRPRWDFDQTVDETVAWYRDFYAGKDARALCDAQLERYAAAMG